MGFFKDIKDIKDMKEMVARAPGVITHAQQVAAQGEQLMAATAAAQQLAAEEATQKAEQEIAAEAATADLTPIAGVPLELYAPISKELAPVGYEASKAVEIAWGKGASAESWQQAMDGWNARIAANAAVGKQFNQLYAGADHHGASEDARRICSRGRAKPEARRRDSLKPRREAN